MAAMRFISLAVCLLTLGCVHTPEPTATRRGETPIEKPSDTTSLHGEASVWYGSSLR